MKQKLKLKNFSNIFSLVSRFGWQLSLFTAVIGIFLFPRIAFLKEITPENIIALTNEVRIEQGAGILTANQLLAKAAYDKGQTIFSSQTFQHVIDNKKFSSWIRDAGYLYSYVGENLAIDFYTSEGVLEAWQKSPTHNKNLVNPSFKEIGVAVIDGIFKEKATTLVVQIFGTPPAEVISPLVVGTAGNLEIPDTGNPDLNGYVNFDNTFSNLALDRLSTNNLFYGSYDQAALNQLSVIEPSRLNNFYTILGSSPGGNLSLDLGWPQYGFDRVLIVQFLYTLGGGFVIFLFLLFLYLYYRSLNEVYLLYKRALVQHN